MLSAAQWDWGLWVGLKRGFIIYQLWSPKFSLICKALLTPSWQGGYGACQTPGRALGAEEASIQEPLSLLKLFSLMYPIRLLAEASQIWTVLKELEGGYPSAGFGGEMYSFPLPQPDLQPCRALREIQRSFLSEMRRLLPPTGVCYGILGYCLGQDTCAPTPGPSSRVLLALPQTFSLSLHFSETFFFHKIGKRMLPITQGQIGQCPWKSFESSQVWATGFSHPEFI